MYVLVFELDDPHRFERIYGEDVVRVVRDDLSLAFAQIILTLLQQHKTLCGVQSSAFGTWMVPFEMTRTEIEVDPVEQQTSITRAGKELVRRMLQEQLGMGVAVRTEFRFGVVWEEKEEIEPERLHKLIQEKIQGIPLSSFAQPKIDREEFLEIVHTRRIDLHLQPVVSLQTGQTVGVEALARGPVGSSVREAGPLFGAASYFGVQEELELACVGTALEWAPHIPSPYWLSINLGPDLLTQARLQHLIHVEWGPGPLERKVFEITEHLPIPSAFWLRQAMAPFRERGVKLALDDAGCGFFNLDLVQALTPDIVKICITVVHRIVDHPQVRQTVRTMVSRIKDAGGIAVGEGVEQSEQARILVECGVELAQGFLFARPRPAGEVLAELP